MTVRKQKKIDKVRRQLLKVQDQMKGVSGNEWDRLFQESRLLNLRLAKLYQRRRKK